MAKETYAMGIPSYVKTPEDFFTWLVTVSQWDFILGVND